MTRRLDLKTIKYCGLCSFDLSDFKGNIYEAFNLCKKHKKPKEIKMQCSACGSQDTTPKSGVSKTGKNAGKPWKAYDCNEPQCKNEKGYPTRTFVNLPKTAQAPQGSGSLVDLQSIVKKVDECLAILRKNFGTVTVQKDEEETPF